MLGSLSAMSALKIGVLQVFKVCSATSLPSCGMILHIVHCSTVQATLWVKGCKPRGGGFDPGFTKHNSPPCAAPRCVDDILDPVGTSSAILSSHLSVHHCRDSGVAISLSIM
jgi:hypothetical protein